MNFKKIKLFLFGLPKTLRFNFHYFPFKTAIKLPVLLTHRVRIKSLKGKVILPREKINRGLISIGFNHVSINDINEYSLWNVEGTVIFKGSAGFGAGTKIGVGQNAYLNFGKNFNMTARSEIGCFKEITFGDDCLLSWNILIMDTDAHPVYDQRGIIVNEDKSIKVGNKVWIGCRSLILKGVEIPDNCVIGANSFVNKKFETENSIIAGNPAKVVKENVKWG